MLEGHIDKQTLIKGGIGVVYTAGVAGSMSSLYDLATEYGGWAAGLGAFIPVTCDSYWIIASMVMMDSTRTRKQRWAAAAHMVGAIVLSVAGNLLFHELNAGDLRLSRASSAVLVAMMAALPVLAGSAITHLAVLAGFGTKTAGETPVPVASGTGNQVDGTGTTEAAAGTGTPVSTAVGSTSTETGTDGTGTPEPVGGTGNQVDGTGTSGTQNPGTAGEAVPDSEASAPAAGTGNDTSIEEVGTGTAPAAPEGRAAALRPVSADVLDRARPHVLEHFLAKGKHITGDELRVKIATSKSKALAVRGHLSSWAEEEAARIKIQKGTEGAA